MAQIACTRSESALFVPYQAMAAEVLQMRQVIPPISPEYEQARIIEREDGFYWQSKDNGREYGPFATLLEAKQDMSGYDDAAPEPGETPQEAESEIGIADWIDPETGEPAEEERPRIEDH